jgi:transcription elongation factor Elf1
MADQTSAVHGIPCPECSFTIPTTIEILLSRASITCPMCGLVLHVDADKSAESLTMLSKLHQSAQEVESVRSKWS